jgi:hypothetical protein
VENLYNKSDVSIIESFVFLLRSSSIFFPGFLKFVLTVERMPGHPVNKSRSDKIIEILGTKKVIEINDSEIFKKGGKDYLDFALYYGLKDIPDLHDASKRQRCVDMALLKCQESYRKVIMLV